MITKAYKTLTDEASRENWEKYGNPDGYHVTSVTIGLPSFLTKRENEIPVLIIYFVVFCIVLPIVVGKRVCVCVGLLLGFLLQLLV